MIKKFDAIRHCESDREFLVHILDEICSYAVGNNLSPNDTIITIAKNMIMLCEISDFDNWGCK